MLSIRWKITALPGMTTLPGMTSLPGTTIIALDIPPDHLLGIDTQFFNSNDIFKGLKAIPDGLHIFHWGKDQMSVRHGQFFEARGGEIMLFRWHKKTEMMEFVDSLSAFDFDPFPRLPEFLQFMIPYPSGLEEKWGKVLRRSVTSTQLQAIVPGGAVSSISSSKEENDILRESLIQSAQQRAERSGRELEEDEIIKSIVDEQANEDRELRFTHIDAKKTWGPNMVGSAVTENYLDKSWYLNSVILRESTMESLLSEMQICFSIMMIFANYSCAEQWKRIISLFSKCKKDAAIDTQRYIAVLDIARNQLEECPADYIHDLLGMTFLMDLFTDFKRCVMSFGELLCTSESMSELKSKLSAFRQTLVHRLEIELDEGGSEDEDEEDEKPTIVEL